MRAEVLRDALLGQSISLLPWLVLLGWTAAAVAAVTRFFRWDG